MTHFDRQYRLQAGRCWICQRFTLPCNLTKDHIFPRVSGQRSANGGEFLLAHRKCNECRGALTIGSLMFDRWLRRVMHGSVTKWRRFKKRSTRR